MKHFTIFIIFIFLSILPFTLSGQTLDDLKKLEQLKNQLEKSGQIIAPSSAKIESTQVQSLQTFKNELTPPPATDTTRSMLTSPLKGEPVAQKMEKGTLPLFGYDVFAKARVDYSPEEFGPVDDSYPLGAGDEIIITVWGEVELRYSKTINRTGQVYIDRVGLVKLAGLSIRQARQKLKRIMGKSYSSLLKGKAFLDVTAGKLRSIRLFVVGDVAGPGIFTVPALTSPFSMLFYAGGVLKTGSLRNISLIRNNRVIEHLDFYDFLLKGQKYASSRLQNHDVILVPTANKHVFLKGAVNKPAVFELKAQEGLTDLIRFSGGFKENAYIESIRIERYSEYKSRELLNVNYKDLRKKHIDFPLLNGDSVLVDTVNRDLNNYVTISGPIYGPTQFEFYPGMTIKNLFAEVDSIAGDAYLDRVQISRTLPDKKKQIFSINLRKFFETEGQDFLLAPKDHISIKSVKTLYPEDYVFIYGAVNDPGRYILKKDMTLKDLIFAAGGFRKDALISEAEISRVNPKQTKANHLADIVYVKIDSNYTKKLKNTEDELFFLKAYDNIFIRANSDWELQRNVDLEGEVKLPGIYTLRSKTERISDLIERAGGLKQTAYLEGAKIYRYKNGVGQIGIDFKKIFNNPHCEENIFLQGGDKIIIPEKLATVKIVGGVHFPSSVLFEKGKGLNYYIKAAGGFTELADKSNTTVRLANGRSIQEKRFLFWKYLPQDITAGSTILVPVMKERKTIDWSGAVRDAAAILSSVATTILIIDRIRGK